MAAVEGAGVTRAVRGTEVPLGKGLARRLAAALVMGCLLIVPAMAQAPATHVLIITGLSGEPSFAASFASVGGALHDAARTTWGVPADGVQWLAEDASRDPTRITGRSTRGAIDSAFTRLASRSRPGDLVAVFLVGHGSGAGGESRVSLPGADPTAAEYARWLDRLDGRNVVMIVGASGSGDFLPALAQSGRIVITATRSPTERNESYFASRLAHGLASQAADADKDGKVTVMEAYLHARAEVAKAYEADGRLQTEHAQFDDNGDGRGVSEPATEGGAEGAVMRRIAFGRAAVVSDPRMVTLMNERQALEEQVEALRRRKDTMQESAYLAELERLLLQIAERTRAIRSATPGSRP